MRFDKKSLGQELLTLLAMIALISMARSSLADHYYVPSGSMEYSLLPGDRVFVDKMAYGLRLPFTTIDILGAEHPERGDVAIFDSPRDGTRLIKRVVAISGDVVTLEDGHLQINGHALGDAHIEHFGAKQAMLNLEQGGGPDIERMEVPAGMVLALGDHRGNSLDGRFFGLVSERALYGRAVAVYYRRGAGFTWQRL
jgi:signal peptidase I